MTERITKIVMNGFRGVPQTFEVECPDACSLAVLGDNARGKSTIADALEWYFTGGIDFLRKEGREHAIQHVAPDSHRPASVEISTTGSLGGRVQHPDNSPRAVTRTGSRETFLLSGRTLSDFVNKRKAEKWNAIVDILGLAQIDTYRGDLERARNELRNAAGFANAAVNKVESILRGRFGNPITESRVLSMIQQQCEKAGLAPPLTLDAALEPQWVESLTGADEGAQRSAFIEGVISAIKLVGPVSEAEAIRDWNTVVFAGQLSELPRLRLMQAAEAVVPTSGDACPLCGQAIDNAQLELAVANTLNELRSTQLAMQEASGRINTLVSGLKSNEAELKRQVAACASRGIELDAPPQSPAASLERDVQQRALMNEETVLDHIEAVQKWQNAALARLSDELTAAKAASKKPAVLQTGTIIGEVERWVRACAEATRLKAATELADRVCAAFVKQEDEFVTKLLSTISGRVAEIYAALHPGEPITGVAVERWEKGVELALDFHGRRQRPPHGVLSESHLNSLGIALFLAMAETFNEKLRFMVLDDVVNSFDMEHRGHLAELLATQFTDWQLLVLTHDAQFYDRLTRLAPSWRKLEFLGWSYEDGPRTTRVASTSVTRKARERLDAGDLDGTAQKGRRGLEDLLQEMCEALEAPLPFRRGYRNERRDATELMSGLRRVIRDRELPPPIVARLKELLPHIDADISSAFNVEAHAGPGQASGTELKSALERVEQLEEMWVCKDCGRRGWPREKYAIVLCVCGVERFR